MLLLADSAASTLVGLKVRSSAVTQVVRAYRRCPQNQNSGNYNSLLHTLFDRKDTLVSFGALLGLMSEDSHRWRPSGRVEHNPRSHRSFRLLDHG